MRKALFLSVFALCATPALAAETGQCDATAFTLAKPMASASKAAKPTTAKATSKSTAAKSKPVAKARAFAPCNDRKKKKRG
jgi:hypothetical protein